MKHTNKLIITLSAILVVILCLTLISCQDSENESASTDANKSDNTLVTTETIVTTKSDTNLETDSFEETSSVQATEDVEETTVIQETETTKSTNTEETSDIQETGETTVILETETTKSTNTEETSDIQETGETTVILETETTESTNTEETSDIQETEGTTVIQETESESESETETETESEIEELYEIKVDDYTLIKNENGCYLTFDDISKYKNNSNASGIIADVIFNSIKDFKDTVTKGLLTDGEKSIVADFSKDENDYIKMCDFNNLYEPILPESSAVTSVYWKGEYYSFGVQMSDGSFGYIRYYTEEIYNQKYQSEYEDFFNKDTITVNEVETIDGKEIIYYKTTKASFYNERYTLTIGNKIVTVDRNYASSNVIPRRITLYCTEENLYYTVTLHNLTEDPTDEWLLEFGLKPYIENDHEVM